MLLILDAQIELFNGSNIYVKLFWKKLLSSLKSRLTLFCCFFILQLQCVIRPYVKGVEVSKIETLRSCNFSHAIDKSNAWCPGMLTSFSFLRQTSYFWTFSWIKFCRYSLLKINIRYKSWRVKPFFSMVFLISLVQLMVFCCWSSCVIKMSREKYLRRFLSRVLLLFEMIHNQVKVLFVFWYFSLLNWLFSSFSLSQDFSSN